MAKSEPESMRAAEAAIRAGQDATIAKGRTLRAVELAWGKAIRAVHPDRILGDFTERERRQLRDILKRHGHAGTVALMGHACRRWGMLRRTQPWLPLTPTWGAFYVLRDEIAADMAGYERRRTPVRPLDQPAEPSTGGMTKLSDLIPAGKLAQALKRGLG